MVCDEVTHVDYILYKFEHLYPHKGVPQMSLTNALLPVHVPNLYYSPILCLNLIAQLLRRRE